MTEEERAKNVHRAAVFRAEATKTSHKNWAETLNQWAARIMREAYPEPQLDLFNQAVDLKD